MAWLDGARVSGKPMYRGPIGNSATLLYTAPAASGNVTNSSTTAIVKEITISGRKIANATISIFVVETAASPLTENDAVLLEHPVPVNDARVISFEHGIDLAPGWTVQAVASAGSAVNIFMSGVEVL